MEYLINYEKITKKIKKSGAKKVCIQLPEGLKNKALEISKKIEEETGCTVIIWGGTNYGGCDIPTHLECMGIDMIIHFGHSEFPI